jgi:hypothetical protein
VCAYSHSTQSTGKTVMQEHVDCYRNLIDLNSCSHSIEDSFLLQYFYLCRFGKFLNLLLVFPI